MSMLLPTPTGLSWGLPVAIAIQRPAPNWPSWWLHCCAAVCRWCWTGVDTIVTPGETVDVIITERGISVNPRREDLLDSFKGSGLPVLDIHDLQRLAFDLAGRPESLPRRRRSGGSDRVSRRKYH